MGWEERNGRMYYYRKKRAGTRVISEYIGRGDLAEAVAAHDAWARAEREAEREEWRETTAAELETAAAVDHLGAMCMVLTRAVLLASGHHTHRGQWRWKRGR
jgi:hypothetical protein